MFSYLFSAVQYLAHKIPQKVVPVKVLTERFHGALTSRLFLVYFSTCINWNVSL